MEPASSTDLEGSAETSVRPIERTIDTMTASYPGTAVLGQLFLFPVKLGLSIALASTAILLSPILMMKPPERADSTR